MRPFLHQRKIAIAATLSFVFMVAPFEDASAGDSVAQCHGYARQAVEQARENVSKKCGYTGNAWGDYYDGHFNFCRSAKSSSVDREVKARVDALNLCNACRGYAQQAVDQAKANQNNKCGNTGHRWGDYYEGHFNFCKTAKKSTIDAEVKARVDALNACNACSGYAHQAVSQARENVALACNFGGNRWGDYYEGHLGWCMTAKKSTIDAEVKARTDGLNHCKRCRGYADQAVAQQKQNLAQKCYIVGPAWGDYFEGHFRWCQGAKKSSADHETNLRNAGLRKCRECQGYAKHALQQRSVFLANNCGGRIYGPEMGNRWGDYELGHYQWCMAAKESSIDHEVAWREDEIRKCKADEPVIAPPTEASKPLVSQCNFQAQIRLKDCCQGGNTERCEPMEHFAKTADACGYSEEEAEFRAKIAVQIPLDEDKDDDGPEPGHCTFEIEVAPGCNLTNALCPVPTHTRSYQPTPSAPAPNSKTGAPAGDSSKKKIAKPCTGGQLGTEPNCYCPKGTRLISSGSTKRCIKLAQPTVPAKPSKPQQTTPPATTPKAKRPCPPGTVGIPPLCVPLKQDKPKKEQDKPKKEQDKPKKEKPKRDCGPGYRELDKPNKYGAYCEEIAPANCPAGWTGKPPACQPPAPKPAPAPVPDPVGPSPKCAPPKIGTPPNCRCPNHLDGPNCEIELPK